MPAKNIYHDAVVDALKADGWCAVCVIVAAFRRSTGWGIRPSAGAILTPCPAPDRPPSTLGRAAPARGSGRGCPRTRARRLGRRRPPDFLSTRRLFLGSHFDVK